MQFLPSAFQHCIVGYFQGRQFSQMRAFFCELVVMEVEMFALAHHIVHVFKDIEMLQLDCK